MIVLDAATLVAFLDRDDQHHAEAVQLLVDHAGEPLLTSALNRAEVLVAPTRTGRLGEALAALETLQVEEVPFPENAATALAELRVRAGSTMPDSCVLLVALRRSAAVATFDERLRRSAEACELRVLP